MQNGNWGQQPPGYGPPPSQQPGYGPPQGYGGYPQQPPPPKKSGPSAGLIAIIVGVCLFGGCVLLVGIGAASKSSKKGGSDSAAAADFDVAVDASQLQSDYEANEVSADAKYKGKRLKVTGEVTSIDKDFTDTIIVKMSSGNFLGASLYGISSDAAGKLQKGRRYEFICKGEGIIIGSPMLRHCEGTGVPIEAPADTSGEASAKPKKR